MDRYKKDRQKKLKQLQYKFYSKKITDAERHAYDKLSLNYSATLYQPQCTLDDYREYNDTIISDIFLGDANSIALLQPSNAQQI